MSNVREPPPSYNEAIRSDLNAKQQYGTSGPTPSPQQHAGPAWCYHYPQEPSIQSISPYTSLQYDDFAETCEVTPIELGDLGDSPVQLNCPYCQLVIVTVTHQEVGCLAYSLSALLCLFGCWPCALLPCCLTDMLDVTHYCPNCKRNLGTHKRLDV